MTPLGPLELLTLLMEVSCAEANIWGWGGRR